MGGITNILKGIGGEFEVVRSLGAFGILAYVLGVQIFVGYEVFYAGKAFDLVAYCTAFPGGLSVAIAAVAGSAAVKDRQVATARVINDTGAVPAPPPAGPEVPVTGDQHVHSGPGMPEPPAGT